MNRTALALAAAVAALAAVTGFASVSAPSGSTAGAKTAARLPVERSSLVCPVPSTSDVAETTYTAFTPAGKGGGAAGTAQLLPSVTGPGTDAKKSEKGKKGGPAGTEKPVVSLKEPGKPVTDKESGGDSPALIGSADGLLAPGWTAQQTTTVDVGGSRGVLGTNCTPPDTDFWFPGAGTSTGRQDYVHLTNPDDSAAVVDIELYGKDGVIKSDVGEGITVPARSTVPVLLSTLAPHPTENLTAHVTTRTGRVGAVVQSMDDKLGSDWIPASAAPARRLVLPGIPADATSVRLVAFTPGSDDVDLKVQLAAADGTITPAGHETLHLKSGMTAAADLADVTRGAAGSLVLSQSGNGKAPVVAALRVVRGKGTKQEVAFIPATAAVGERSSVADNRSKGSVLSLAAPFATAKVKVTSSAGSEGGQPVVKTYTVKGGTTLAVKPEVPAGLKGSYALTVEPEPGGGQVYAARTLELPLDGVPMFTVQTLPDDRGTVSVPQAKQDLTLLGN
ncbi:DUF5719 family protein [Streptomyces sp. NBC_01500]|uniref:DUF5719 family protein n=1 Tax=unclassified Streptomyces TaxID=2593676 RepID=UPI002259F65A|nr:DUF5719 family protein [Streptomyces sp. NBC_01500]MCX4550722.1 DUF5719 family protein [Streptomyces sp. NBC_01500]